MPAAFAIVAHWSALSCVGVNVSANLAYSSRPQRQESLMLMQITGENLR